MSGRAVRFHLSLVLAIEEESMEDNSDSEDEQRTQSPQPRRTLQPSPPCFDDVDSTASTIPIHPQEDWPPSDVGSCDGHDDVIYEIPGDEEDLVDEPVYNSDGVAPEVVWIPDSSTTELSYEDYDDDLEDELQDVIVDDDDFVDEDDFVDDDKDDENHKMLRYDTYDNMFTDDETDTE